MGYSAGGYLALLYAYKAAMCKNCVNKEICGTANVSFTSNCDKHKVSPDIPVALVISEAGPTNLNPSEWGSVRWASNNVSNSNQSDASPINNISDDAPYTILAYGNGVLPKFNHYDDSNGDGLIPYSQVTTITQRLTNNGVDYALFTFNGVYHDQFGDNENSIYSYRISPTSTEEIVQDYYYGKDVEGQIVTPGLQQLINIHLFGNN